MTPIHTKKKPMVNHWWRYFYCVQATVIHSESIDTQLPNEFSVVNDWVEKRFEKFVIALKNRLIGKKVYRDILFMVHNRGI